MTTGVPIDVCSSDLYTLNGPKRRDAMEAFRETRRLLAVVALGALAVAASPQIERPPRETAPNPHCKCTQELTMKDFVPVAGKSDRWLIAQFRSEEHTSELQSPCNLV